MAALCDRIAAASSDGIEAFDWDVAKLRNTAMKAIRALADLPLAPEAIAAWMKSNSCGEPVETLERGALLAWALVGALDMGLAVPSGR